ncbi:hypothetical protein BGZ61DRAFT_28557 [Ilyonectria robusta]|uniref:uncharacterized protein n=1 Tax=Ilyonectria robusta TaxID=1079257 RepID=UPI001E8DF939|nr:uncharacterized protein BGZ61DRAFT_28557 [Ilyonectria robusta]KAH8738142.1 hypothetical protein BGZ61DRAFT_28557 [Ilyonectria robusta]
MCGCLLEKTRDESTARQTYAERAHTKAHRQKSQSQRRRRVGCVLRSPTLFPTQHGRPLNSVEPRPSSSAPPAASRFHPAVGTRVQCRRRNGLGLRGREFVASLPVIVRIVYVRATGLRNGACHDTMGWPGLPGWPEGQSCENSQLRMHTATAFVGCNTVDGGG